MIDGSGTTPNKLESSTIKSCNKKSSSPSPLEMNTDEMKNVIEIMENHPVTDSVPLDLKTI